MSRPKGFHHTEEWKAKMSAARLANNPWPKGSKHSDADKEKMRENHNDLVGPDSPSWKGGRTMSVQGYVWIYMPDHPYAINGRYVLEHRLVLEKKLGRILEPSEIVHHINHDKQDNRPENLMLLSSSEHSHLHRLAERVAKNK